MERANAGVLFALVLAVAMLSGCSGRIETTSTALGPVFQPTGPCSTNDQPVLDLPGSAAYQAIRHSDIELSSALRGSESYQRSSEAVCDYDQGMMFLYSSQSPVCWAKYAFLNLGYDRIVRSLTIELGSQLPQEYFVGFSDFTHSSWSWVKVANLTGTDLVALPDGLNFASKDGLAFVCVSAPTREFVAIRSISVNFDSVAPCPVGLAATTTHGALVELSWEDPAVTYPGLDYSLIRLSRRLPGESAFSQIALVDDGLTSYQDIDFEPENDLPAEQDIQYRVQTIAHGVAGMHSLPVTGRLGQDTLYFLAEAAAIPDRILLTWDVQPKANSYIIDYRASSTGEYVELHIINNPLINSFEHVWNSPSGKECELNVFYNYRLKAVFDSYQLVDYTGAKRYYFGPDSFYASYAEFTDRVELSWTCDYGDPVGYLIYRDGTEEEDIIAELGNTRQYTDYVNDASLHAYNIRISCNGDLGYLHGSTGCAISDEWNRYCVDPGESSGKHCTMVLVSGKPVIAFYDPPSSMVKVAVSQQALPESVCDWNVYSLAEAFDREIALFTYSDRLAICFWEDGLVYAEADSLAPDSPEDWQMHVLSGNGENSYSYSAISYGGLAHLAYTLDGAVILARAEVASPTEAGDWEFHVVDIPAQYTYEVSLAAINNLLGACYRTNLHELFYARANIDVPASAQDWVRMRVNNNADYGISDLSIIDGKPAVFCCGYSDLYITQALIAQPTLGSDWTTTLIDGSTSSSSCSAAGLNGNLVTCYDEGRTGGYRTAIKLATSATLEPSGEEDWLIEALAPSIFKTEIGPLIESDGSLSLCYYVPDPDYNLMFAFKQP